MSVFEFLFCAAIGVTWALLIIALVKFIWDCAWEW